MMIMRRQQRQERCRFITHSHSSPTTSRIGIVGMMILLLLATSTKPSVAFVPLTIISVTSSSVSFTPSNTILSSSLMKYRVAPRTMAVATESEPQQQQQQFVDDEYFTALQNFAAASAATVNIDKDTNDAAVAATTSVTSTEATTWRDDGFIFGLNEGLKRPTGKQALIVVEGDSMETQPYQVALVSFTLLNHFCYSMSSIWELYHTNLNLAPTNVALWTTVVQIVSLSVFSWISADFGSGVLHWSVDNYGNGRTPIMGNIIAAFQGHHTAPWTITQRSFFNNVYKLCLPFGIVPVTLFAYLTGPMVTYFLTTFCALEILSQEFHKWSHQTKSETPWIGHLLQKYHLSIGRVPHTKHHTLPFETNYCIISGICNPLLDRYGFFRRLEHFIYQRNGIESNAWKLDPILRQRTLNGIYTPPEL